MSYIIQGKAGSGKSTKIEEISERYMSVLPWVYDHQMKISLWVELDILICMFWKIINRHMHENSPQNK